MNTIVAAQRWIPTGPGPDDGGFCVELGTLLPNYAPAGSYQREHMSPVRWSDGTIKWMDATLPEWAFDKFSIYIPEARHDWPGAPAIYTNTDELLRWGVYERQYLNDEVQYVLISPAEARTRVLEAPEGSLARGQGWYWLVWQGDRFAPLPVAGGPIWDLVKHIY